MQVQDTPSSRPLSEDELLLVDEFRRAKVRREAASVFSSTPNLAPTAIQYPTDTYPVAQSQPYLDAHTKSVETPVEDPQVLEMVRLKRGRWAVLGVNILIASVLFNPGLNQSLEAFLGLSNALQSISPSGTQPLPSPSSPPLQEPLPTPDTTPSPVPGQPPVPSPAQPAPNTNPTPNPSPALPEPATPAPTQPVQPDRGGVVSDAQLAQFVLAYFRKNNWVVREGARRYNIAYIQTMDMDNTLNGGRYNAFDDARVLFEVINGQPRIVGKWQATTRPGDYYYRNPMNGKGTAHLQTRRQFRAWIMGVHRRGDHPALVQHGGPVNVLRTNGRPSTVTGDPPEGRPDQGFFGINQHGVVNQNMDREDIQRASAGCLVAQNWSDHTQFIQYLRNDADFVANPKYVWHTGIIPGRDILRR